MGAQAEAGQTKADKALFWACFMSLIATAFGFVVRSMIIKDLGAEFDLSPTQQGEIFGAGLWPFAISIVLFSLIVDKIGYGRAMAFAFVCHVVSCVMTIFATGYWSLYLATFIMTLGNGSVEAVINPVVATMFSKEKTKWLNILHAGWPGGLVVGGVMAIALTAFGIESWKWKVGLVLIPTIVYGVMMIGHKFPVHERVAAGVSYHAMLKEVGILGALIIVSLMTFEVGRVFDFARFGAFEIAGGKIPYLNIAIIVVLVGAFGAFTKSLGQPLFIFLLFIMMPLATTELGTDSWITPLMEGEMGKLGLNAAWVLVYTSFIMMVLRFSAGSIVHRISPLGLLAASAAIAALGLVSLSYASGVMILLAATLYAFGKTFFWPTMLGVVAERFPKGGAMTINTIAGVGMLSVGIVGAVFMGKIQDSAIDRDLLAYDQKNNTQFHANLVTEKKTSIFGDYLTVDQKKLEAESEENKAVVKEVSMLASKGALRTVAVLPCIMLVCYIILIVYFQSQGGYKPIHLEGEGGSAH
ncbi:MAG: MFS transporter [Candidatus Hydrogenedentes bacterium]|nr:MFS transporter [Candidatus Hydrogenedentota bacterium]